MTLAEDIRTARLAVDRLLDDLRLSEVAYTIEHRTDGWTVLVARRHLTTLDEMAEAVYSSSVATLCSREA